jgi:hypothetical protein
LFGAANGPAFLANAEGAGGHELLALDLREGGVPGRGIHQQLAVQREHDGPVVGVQEHAHRVAHLCRGGQNDGLLPLTYILGGGGHGVQGQICDILTQASYESLPAPSGHTDSHTLDTNIWRWGSDIRSMSSIRPICKCRFPPLHLWMPSGQLKLLIFQLTILSQCFGSAL